MLKLKKLFHCRFKYANMKFGRRKHIQEPDDEFVYLEIPFLFPNLSLAVGNV